MIVNTQKIKILLYGITLLTALVILADFILPGKVFTEQEVDVQGVRENYYNAGGNSHITYKAMTDQHQFSVSENFAKSVRNRPITYSVSLLFKKINRYGLTSSGKNEIYSFRWASGLILPLIVIIVLVIAYKYEKRISTLVAVLQITLLINLILLVK